MPAPPPDQPRDNPRPNPSEFRGHPVGLGDDALLKQCTTRRSRASGPGGQHRNKVETAIELTHTPTGITASASERRSQADNKRVALKRLRLKLAIEHRSEIDPADLSGPPSELWQSRIKAKRIVLNKDHADFPVMLAEALDTLAALNYDTTKAATLLSVTGSQLVRLFQKEPAVLAKVNVQRDVRGLGFLR